LVNKNAYWAAGVLAGGVVVVAAGLLKYMISHRASTNTTNVPNSAGEKYFSIVWLL